MARLHPHKRAARLAALSLITVAGVLAAVWAAPRVSEAVEAWVTTPGVELHSATLPADLPVAGASPAAASEEPAAGSMQARGAGAQSARSAAAPAVTVDAGMRFTMAGVVCTPPARQGSVIVRLRVSEDRRTWSRWYAVELERAAEEGGEEKAFTELVWTGAGRYLQVKAESAGTARKTPTRLRDVRVVAVNGTEDADRAAVVVGVLRRTVATIARVGGAGEAEAMPSQPKIVTRAQWGANESWRKKELYYAPVKMAFVHHTASGNGYSASQVKGIVQGVYRYHTKALGWNDIGYNFLIDRFGTIYEGRYGGVTKGVVGAHVLGFNTGSTGISVIGTYSSTTPSSKSVAALKKLLAWKLDVHHVNPLGKGTLICATGQKYPKGRAVTFPAVAGHRNANYTTCPGSRLYARLPDVRAVAAKTGLPKIYNLFVRQPAFSPDGDGVHDSTAFGFTVSRKATTWSLEISDSDGKVVRTKKGSLNGSKAKAVECDWAGLDDSGKVLPDGVYTARVTAKGGGASARAATTTVRADTVPPSVGNVSVAPDPFSPNGDGQGDVTTFSFVPSEVGTARVSVVDDEGTVLRRLTDWKSVAAAQQKVKWDGRIQASSGSGLVQVSQGAVVLRVEVRDRAGNTVRAQRPVTVDRTLKLVGVTRTTISPNGDNAYDKTVVSFSLKQQARVTVVVRRDGATVRTLRQAQLEKGSHSVEWGGALDGGDTAANGSYNLRITAESEFGTTSVVQAIIVDLTKPTVTASSGVTVKYGKTAKVGYKVRDAYSSRVSVSAKVTDSTGRTVATRSLGWVKQGVGHVFSWKPPARKTYTVTFTAKDRGGNRQAAPAVSKIRVK